MSADINPSTILSILKLFNKRNRANAIFGIIVALIIIAIGLISPKSIDTNVAGLGTERYLVTEVVDGDTIKASIKGEIETIRLIGIDTPETVDPRKTVQCFGKEASNYTKSKLAGKRVSLQADYTQDDRDKYGRLLRYVSLEDGSNFNLELISQGYAHEYTYQVPYQFQSQFKAAEVSAKKQSLGLWGPTCATK